MVPTDKQGSVAAPDIGALHLIVLLVLWQRRLIRRIHLSPTNIKRNRYQTQQQAEEQDALQLAHACETEKASVADGPELQICSAVPFRASPLGPTCSTGAAADGRGFDS